MIAPACAARGTRSVAAAGRNAAQQRAGWQPRTYFRAALTGSQWSRWPTLAQEAPTTAWHGAGTGGGRRDRRHPGPAGRCADGHAVPVDRSRSVIAQAGQASMGRAGSSHLGNVARWGGQSDVTTKEPARNDRPARSSQTAVREARENARGVHSYPGVGRRRLGGSPPLGPRFFLTSRCPAFCSRNAYYDPRNRDVASLSALPGPSHDADPTRCPLLCSSANALLRGPPE